MCIEREVDIVRVVGHVDLSLLGRGRTVERRLLHELRDQSCRLPYFVVEASVDHRRRVGAGGTHRRTVGNQTGILHTHIYHGYGLIFALGLASDFAGHEGQNKADHHGHTGPHLPGVLPRSVVYGPTHAQHTPHTKSRVKLEGGKRRRSVPRKKTAVDHKNNIHTVPGPLVCARGSRAGTEFGVRDVPSEAPPGRPWVPFVGEILSWRVQKITLYP